MSQIFGGGGTAAVPEVAQSNRRPSANITIADGYCAILKDYIRILSTNVITLQGDAVLVII